MFSRYHVVKTPGINELAAALVAFRGKVDFTVLDDDGTHRPIIIEVEVLQDARCCDNVADQAGPLPVGMLGTENSWVVVGSLVGRVPLGEPLATPLDKEDERELNLEGVVTAGHKAFISCDPGRGFGVIGVYPENRSDGEDGDMPFYDTTLQHLVYGNNTWL